MIRGRRAPSIAVPIFLLALASLLISIFALFAVTFRGPPPRPDRVRIDAIATMLQSGKRPGGVSEQVHFAREAEFRPPPPFEQRAPMVEARLARLLGARPEDIRGFVSLASGSPDSLRGRFTVGWRQEGGWRMVTTRPPGLLTAWHRWTLAVMLVLVLVLGALSWLIARVISRPIGQLAEAADTARVGAEVPIPSGGPREVQALARSIGAMKQRLTRQVEGRTAMLAAIAHDMGTPLSRLAFWMEQLPEESRGRASADLDEMRAMLKSVLRFAREEHPDAAPARIDLGSLIESLADDMAAAGADVTVEPGPRAVIRADAGSLKRLFGNLVQNALRYGHRARLCWATDGAGAVVVAVEDDGPGFPADASRLFEPFVRGDPSRNRATGGTGLGLAIVRSIAEAHGGTVTLGNTPAGGRVTVRLPLA